ncbi:tRNA (adenosine(37)-N6)-dimethylallyltransferase MiaA [Roseibacillus persicicus]|uniref:tRNA dimethylallyltransferase n=1 Tax=Roseibacillus persicicus TaxID=454148 RepID=A0A918TTX4_9BACT|nr:tRNA (adenosine(37)-N6)-dimethylallyltransferase MiaA [Roseibacillus persicicus]GHC63189.1 tRNA dimethylallyltransferase [Roseibacillus persicicus]
MAASPLYICGPTASGKSSLALNLAEALDGEIINADAYQLYQGLETLAASPTLEEQEAVPHHLYSVLDLAETLDANRYRKMALPIIEEIQSRGKTPIIVGGSGLYLKFLTHGPSPVPPGDPTIRAELDLLSLEELLARLETLDPAEAATINRQNRRYVTRSLELCLLTGQPVSELRKDWQQPDPPDLRGVYLDWPRDELADRIAQRTAIMLAGDALDEVAALPPDATTAAKAIGVAEIQAHLAGKKTLEETSERITIATRQYAKRQRTWFRKEAWLTPIERNELPEELLLEFEIGETK